MSLTVQPRYVIHCLPYNPNNGGEIVLHKLCHVLNQMGEIAVLHRMPPFHGNSWRKKLRNWSHPQKYVTDPTLTTPVTLDRYAQPNDIVIYPEIVTGNPMRARNVVRWLLNRPSFVGWKVDPGPDDLFFKYDLRCDEPAMTKGLAPLLFLFSANATYRQTNFGARHGSCYMFRKSKDRALVHDLNDSLLLDGLSHDEINRAFNERDIFYCYDEMSSYSQFAAICGCTSIVIPSLYANREEFAKNYPLSRYGVAYGLDDIDHARATRHLVSDYLLRFEQDGLESVRNFITTTRQAFGRPPS